MNDFQIKGPYNPEGPKPKKQAPVLDLNNDLLKDVKHIICVASGKGGVGKSTVAVNLAITLARQGWRVGLADADVYGPSVPKMTGTEGVMPEIELFRPDGSPLPEGEEFTPDCKEIFVPVRKYGVKWMSIGYFAKPEQALIWRGPLACTALKQMILQVRWANWTTC